MTERLAEIPDRLIVTAALNGAEVTRAMTPHLPILPDEIAKSAAEAASEGAAVVHVHARNSDGTPTQDGAVYREIIERIRARTDVVVQVSTGGAVGMPFTDRIQALEPMPEMATLTVGSVNFGGGVFLNPPAEIEALAYRMQELGVRPEVEIFDAGMVDTALRLVEKGLLPASPHFDFVMGVPGGIPAEARHLVHLVSMLPPGSTWTVAAVGRRQLPMTVMGMAMGGHVRVGLEDNIFYSRGRLAAGSAELAARAVRVGRELGREPASPDEARAILGISPVK